MDLPLIFIYKDNYYYLFIKNKPKYLSFILVGNNKYYKNKQYNEEIIKLNNEINQSIKGNEANRIKSLISENKIKFNIEFNYKILKLNWSFEFFNFNWKVSMEKTNTDKKLINKINNINFDIISRIIEESGSKLENNYIDYNKYLNNDEESLNNYSNIKGSRLSSNKKKKIDFSYECSEDEENENITNKKLKFF